MPDESGVTLRQHLEQAGKEVEIPEVPYGYFYLVRWFGELDSTRGSNGFGPNPITYPDIDAWSRLTGANPESWEVSVIMKMDAARRAAFNEVNNKKPGGKK